MKYGHNIRLIRKRKHILPISLGVTLILMALIMILGFTTLDMEKFISGFLHSFLSVVIAYVLALVLAVAAVLTVTSRRDIESVMVPILDALQSFPTFSIYPLLLLWFGKSIADVIIILILEMIWPMIFTLISAKKQIKSEVVEAARIFGATGFKYLRYVELPMLLPAIVTGSIVAWGEAWETIIAAEILVNAPGVGNYLSTAGEQHQTNVLVIGILFLLFILFILNKSVWLPLLNSSTKYQQE